MMGEVKTMKTPGWNEDRTREAIFNRYCSPFWRTDNRGGWREILSWGEIKWWGGGLGAVIEMRSMGYT